jgi:4,5-dihydroxyphthalate decarboxylase
MPELFALTRPQGANRALLDAAVAPAGCSLTFADEPVLVQGFRKMVRSLAYDVAEMALTTYLTAKEHGVRFTALPIFLVRDLHHGATQVLGDSWVRQPTDLTGGTVGVNRGYTVTTGVWGRAALAEAGLDLDTVTWVRSGDEHVASYTPPPNVTSAPEGRSLEKLLLAGELDAVVGAGIKHPDVVPLIPDPEEAGMAVVRERGYLPVNHLVVIRDDLLDAQPEVAVAVFEAFAEAKRQYVEQLRAGRAESAQDRLLGRVLRETGQDPLPYGLEPNRAVLEALMETAAAQHILKRAVRLEDLFAAPTLDLVG